MQSEGVRVMVAIRILDPDGMAAGTVVREPHPYFTCSSARLERYLEPAMDGVEAVGFVPILTIIPGV